MPEPPDFNKIARDLLEPIGRPWPAVRDAIAEQLRHVWNARGAADLDAITGELPPQYQVVTAREIRRVDR